MFQLSERDSDEILSTFGVKCEATRSWRLRVERDAQFLEDPAMKKHVVEQKAKWVQKFNELEKSLQESPAKSPKKK